MREQLIFKDAAELDRAAAEKFRAAARESKDVFRVALSGGRTPIGLFSLLSDPSSGFRESIPWEKIHVFWSDERCVPPDSPESNYRSAFDALLSRVPVSPGRIHRVEAELPDPAEAARRYEATVLRELGARPRFDLIFLGLGPDGHTASLFPGSPAVREQSRLVVPVAVDQTVRSRVTFTLPLINAAARVVFLVSGADKADAVRRVFEEPPSESVPAGLVKPVSGEWIWLLDRPAASRLKI